MNIEPRFPALTRSDLDEFERATGLDLPPAYREFLLTNNGGRPDDNRVDVPDYGDAAVNDFLGLQAGDPYDLRSELNMYEDRIPAGSLPVAEDPGGNLFLLSLAGDSRGSVFYWDHEEEPDGDASDWSDFENVYQIAGSFEDFLAGIKPPED